MGTADPFLRKKSTREGDVSRTKKSDRQERFLRHLSTHIVHMSRKKRWVGTADPLLRQLFTSEGDASRTNQSRSASSHTKSSSVNGSASSCPIRA